MNSRNSGPCLPALEAKERGKTLQLKSLREAFPPLHQNNLSPVAASGSWDISSFEHLPFVMLVPCFKNTRLLLLTLYEAEPIVAIESTYFFQSAETARWCKFDSS